MDDVHQISGVLILKDGVRTIGIRPEVLFAVLAAMPLYRAEGFACVVTSVNDGGHSLTSLHYAGCAIDLRTRHIADIHTKERIAKRLSYCLGIDYDVVFHPPGGDTAEHIHVEYQPRRRG
jgi:hypothetical protein